MSTPLTLTIDWLAYTIPSGTANDTMAILEGEWIKCPAGFRGYPLSWRTVGLDRGVGKLRTGAPRAWFNPESICTKYNDSLETSLR
jgi:hypothetical protein